MSPYPTDPLPAPDNIDTQADQAAQLTEPTFDHDMPDEAELLGREFGPPDPDGVYGRVAPVEPAEGGPPEGGPAAEPGTAPDTDIPAAAAATADEDGDVS